MRRPVPVRPGPGQESAWDYPRPPRLEPETRSVHVVMDGEAIAATSHAIRLLETSHPPSYYIPPGDVREGVLQPAEGSSHCEWKGRAVYLDLVLGDRRVPRAAWTYPDPVERYAALRDHVAFYPHLVDACYVGDERARPQPGGFYGGWITDDVVGPFKGEPGTWGW